MRVHELFEAAVPHTDYGYWVTPSGEIIPVGFEQHDRVARANGGGPLGYAIDAGWIRVVVEEARQYSPLAASIDFWSYRLNIKSISGLSRILRAYPFERYIVNIRGVEADHTTLYRQSEVITLMRKFGIK